MVSDVLLGLGDEVERRVVAALSCRPAVDPAAD